MGGEDEIEKLRQRVFVMGHGGSLAGQTVVFKFLAGSLGRRRDTKSKRGNTTLLPVSGGRDQGTANAKQEKACRPALVESAPPSTAAIS